MGLTAALALLRAHVLVVGVPGRALLRLRAEAAVRARGWLLVHEPEDADLLLVCGAPEGAVAAAAQGLWDRVPAPRARRTVHAADGLDAALDSAARVLVDGPAQRAAARPPGARSAPVPTPGAVRFGPLARDWPAGVVVDCRLGRSGRVAGVDVRVLPREPSDPDPVDDGARAAVLDLAAAAALLRVAGWAPPAARLDAVVDRLLAGAAPEGERTALRRVARRVDGSVALRGGLARVVPGLDVRTRLLALLADPGRERTEWRPLAALDGLVGRDPAEVPLRAAAAGWEHADA